MAAAMTGIDKDLWFYERAAYAGPPFFCGPVKPL